MLFSGKNIPSVFGRTKKIEAQIDQFLDMVTEAGLIYAKAQQIYFEQGPEKDFEIYLQRVLKVEQNADSLRRNLETQLLERTLIPDLRSDVLSLIEHVDDIINIYEANLFRFSIQAPKIPKEYHAGYLELSNTAILSVESLVNAVRSFFRDIDAVRDHVTKVMFYESEADQISTKVQRQIFSSSLGLARRRHLAYFIEHIDELANTAEDVADLLSAMTIKRRI
jgi:predicted phosphate transport protein (TIGR00153 family)